MVSHFLVSFVPRYTSNVRFDLKTPALVFVVICTFCTHAVGPGMERYETIRQMTVIATAGATDACVEYEQSKRDTSF